MRAVAALLSVLALAACDRNEPRPETVQSASAIEADDLLSCGGDLKPGAARDYFERLGAVLESGAPVPTSFYAERLNIGSGGRWLRFRRDEFRPGAETLLPNALWREIAARGVGDLKSVGWRGCILGDGKAGFQADENGQLVLSSFDKDKPWVSVRP